MKIQRNIKDFFNSTFTIECSGLELAMICSDMEDSNGIMSKEDFESTYSATLPDNDTCKCVHRDMYEGIDNLLSQYDIGRR